MYVVDASVWVSWLIAADSHHAITRAWLRGELGRGESSFAPMVVLAEVAGAVSRRTGLARLGVEAVSFLWETPGTRWIPIGIDLVLFSANLAAELRLRGTDAIYVAVAQQLGFPLVTWDREQQERVSDAVVTVTPLELLRS